MQARLPSNVETWRLPQARWQRCVVVRSSKLLRFWLKVSNTNSEIGTTCLARARACGASADHGNGVQAPLRFCSPPLLKSIFDEATPRSTMRVSARRATSGEDGEDNGDF